MFLNTCLIFKYHFSFAGAIENSLRDAKDNPKRRINGNLIGSDLVRLQWIQPNIVSAPKNHWLNGIVIEEYFGLISKRSGNNAALPSVHAMGTDFYKNLSTNGFKSISRWSKKTDIFKKDIILVPIHQVNHWCMAIIHVKNKTIKFYNSFDIPNNEALNKLNEYIQMEHLDKKKMPLDLTRWVLENVFDRYRLRRICVHIRRIYMQKSPVKFHARRYDLFS